MQSTLKITAKGQVTLRKKVLDELGLRPGDKITVEVVAPGRAELKAAAKDGTLEAFFGCLHKPGAPKLTIEEINEIIAKGWAGEFNEDDA